MKFYNVRWYCIRCNAHHDVDVPGKDAGHAGELVGKALALVAGKGAILTERHIKTHSTTVRLVIGPSLEVVELVERGTITEADAAAWAMGGTAPCERPN